MNFKDRNQYAQTEYTSNLKRKNKEAFYIWLQLLRKFIRCICVDLMQKPILYEGK